MTARLSDKSPTVKVNTTMPRDLRDRAVAAAPDNNLSALIRHLLREWLAEQGE